MLNYFLAIYATGWSSKEKYDSAIQLVLLAKLLLPSDQSWKNNRLKKYHQHSFSGSRI